MKKAFISGGDPYKALLTLNTTNKQKGITSINFDEKNFANNFPNLFGRQTKVQKFISQSFSHNNEEESCPKFLRIRLFASQKTKMINGQRRALYSPSEQNHVRMTS